MTKGFLSYLELKPKQLPLWHRGSSYPIRNYPLTPDNRRNCQIAVMASRDSLKKEDQGKDVQKQGALDAHVTELCTSLQETMAQGETSGQESSVTGTPPTGRRTVPGRSAPTDGTCH